MPEERPESERRGLSALDFLLLVVLAVAFCWPVLRNIHNLGIGDWDQHFFYHEVPRKTLLEYGQFPLWNPYYMGGNVMLANPQSTFLSPLFLLVMTSGTVVGLKVSIVIHCFIGLAGMYLLARDLRLSRASRLTAAALFGLSGFSPYHLAEGHTNWLCIAYLPWAFRHFQNNSKRHVHWIAPGVFLTLMFFEGGFQILGYVAVFLLLYASTEAIIRREAEPLIKLLCVAAVVVLLGAVKVLPTLEFVHRYPRSMTDTSGTPMYALVGSLTKRDQARDLGFIGQVHGWPEHAFYVGWVPVVAYLVSLVAVRRNIGLKLSGLLALWISLGSTAPVSLWAVLCRAPGFSSQRVPSRWLVVFVFTLAVLTAKLLSDIERRWPGRLTRMLSWLAAAFITFDLVCTNGPALREAFVLEPLHRVELPEAKRFSQVMESPDYGSKSGMFVAARANLGTINGYEQIHVPVSVKSTDANDQQFFVVGDVGDAAMAKWTPNSVSFQVNFKEAGYLVVNQNYEAGWCCRGGEVRSYDGLVGAFVQSGKRGVVFYYMPASFEMGFYVTLLTCVAILLWLVRSRRGSPLARERPTTKECVPRPGLTRRDLLIVFALTAGCVLMGGYEFGERGHANTLALLMSHGDPNAFPAGDLLSTPLHIRYSFFWVGVYWITQILGTGWACFGLFFCLKFSLFLGAYLLAVDLFGRKEIGCLAILLLFMSQPVGGTASTHHMTLTNSNLSLPLFVFAVRAFLQRRYLLSYGLTAVTLLAYPLHGVPAMAAFTVATIAEMKRVGPRNAGLGVVMWLGAAALLSAFAFGSGSIPGCGVMSADWLAVVRGRADFIFPGLWRASDWLTLSVFGVCFVASARCSLPRPVLWIALGIALEWPLAWLLSDIVPVTLAIQLQLMKSTVLFAVLTMVLLAGYCAQLLDGSPFRRALGAALAISSLVASPLFRLILIVIAALLNARRTGRLPVLAGLVVCALAVATLLDGAGHLLFIKPGELCLIACVLLAAALFAWTGGRAVRMLTSIVLIFAIATPFMFALGATQPVHGIFSHLQLPGLKPANEWTRLQLWARRNTPKDALFVVPSNATGFRLFSRRGQVVDAKDGAMVMFDRAFALEWDKRMRDLRRLETTDETEFVNLLTAFASRYGASYAIFRKPKDLPLPLVHQNEEYAVYRVAALNG